MKKLVLYAFAVVTAFGLMTSCSKDEVTPDGPSISFLNNVSTDSAKETDTAYTFVANIEAAGKLKEIKLFDVSDANSETQLGTTITKFDSDTKHTLIYSIDLAGKTGDVKVKISVTDKNDLTNSSTFVLTTYEAPKGNAISTYSAKLVGAQYATEGSFYATTTGTVYKANDAKTNASLVDLVYYYGGSTNKATIGSPKDDLITNAHSATSGFTSWSVYNDTKFTATTMSATDFDAITDDLKMAAVTSLSDTHQNNLTEGTVFAFKTAAGKIGFVKVKSITAGTYNGAPDYQFGTIEIEVKVQK